MSSRKRKPAPVPQSDSPQPEQQATPPSEHTVFVRGTYSGGLDESYFDPGVLDTVQDHVGGETQEEVDWYGGPLSGVSRELAGRSLLRDTVMPAFERGENVNLIAHSHGGNVVGEMAAHFADRMDYLKTLRAGAEGSEEEQQTALEALEARQQQLVDDLDYFSSIIGKLATKHTDGQIADIETEQLEVLQHRQSVLDGDTTTFEAELNTMENGRFGDIMHLNTPFLERHPAVTEVPEVMERTQRVSAARNPNDPTAGLAHANEALVGGQGRDLPHHENLQQVDWSMTKEETRWWHLNTPFTPSGKRQHTQLVDEPEAMQNKFLDHLEP